MNRLLASRQTILDALEAARIAHSVTAQWSAPCVLVEPGEPWASVDLSLGSKRTGRWRLTLVAGRADTAGILDSLAGLVDTVDAALLTIPGVQLPTWQRPFDIILSGSRYAGTSATIQLITPTLNEVSQ
jgi:hypothetical protein